MSKIAFVFPGQGSQAVGMGKDLYSSSPAAAAVLDLAGDAVKRLCFEGPQAELDQTVHAQPCLFAVDLACAAALTEAGVEACGAAGFSLGEIPALAFSGLLSAEQALAFVRLRAEVMQACAAQNPGGMLAVIGLNADAAAQLCEGIDGVYPANFNSEKQTVAAFAEASFEMLTAAVKSAGGRGIRLAAGGAFHCPFMDEAAARIERYLQSVSFGEMKIPLYANATAQVYTAPPAALITRQVNSPVLWHKTIENMIMDGFDTFIEAGPGKTLAGLIKKIDKNVRVFSVSDAESLAQAVSAVGGANKRQ